MNKFLVLHIQEHVYEDIKRIDNRLCILYDLTEETFFYYGSRNNKYQEKYVDFNGYYKSHRKNSLLNFMKFIFGNYEEVFTTELHILDIQESEYSDLNYSYLLDKMSYKTVVSAYDKRRETHDSFSEYLDFLISKTN